MTQHEWELAYPPTKGHSKPAPTQLAHPEPLTTYAEAVSVKDWIEAYHEIGGLLVIEHETLFYVVYDAMDYFKGYGDYTANI